MPGTTAFPSLLAVTPISTWGVKIFISVAELSELFVSFSEKTSTLLTNKPVAVPETYKVSSYVTFSPEASVAMVSSKSPVPELPFEPVQVADNVPSGNISVTSTLVAVLEPLLVTVML